MRERKDEEEELREAMEAGKESTVFARVKVPTQVKGILLQLIKLHLLFLKGGYRRGLVETKEARAA